MFSLLIKILCGYCCIRVTSADPVRILNRLHDANIYFFRPMGEGCTLRFCCMKRDVPAVYRILRGYGITDIDLKGHGIPFLLFGVKRKIIAAVLLSLLIGIPLLSQYFLLEIEVSGNHSLTEEHILATLKEEGIRPYAYIPNLEIEEARQQLLLKQPKLSWATLNRIGNRLEVLVHEKTGSKPVLPEDPCNIVAASDGIICQMEVLSGKQVVKGKTAVKKGQLLVSGFSETEAGKLSYLHAQATVIAEVQLQKSYTVDLAAKDYLPTGEERNLCRLEAFGQTIPLYAASARPKQPFTVTHREKRMRLFGILLPFSCRTERYCLYEERPAALTETDAMAILTERFAEYERYELSDAAILSKGFETVKAGSKITVTGHYLVQRDIARTVGIEVLG